MPMSLTTLLTAFLITLTLTTAKDVFLRGEFIEVGIHNVASYGTSTSTPIPTGFKAKAQASRWNNGLGFIADWADDGWLPNSGGFAGDYFLPGSPLEGWSVEYQTSPSGGENVFIMKGRVGHSGILPTSFERTSPRWTGSPMPHQLNTAVWIGTAGSTLKISKTIQVGLLLSLSLLLLLLLLIQAPEELTMHTFFTVSDKYEIFHNQSDDEKCVTKYNS